jgi:hypothetical protein
MGTPDHVSGIPDPYDNQFKCWNEESREFSQGDEVVPVGIARTYAVRLNSTPGHPARFLWVQDLKITAVMAHQPIVQKSVFNKWGDFLGEGGEVLQEPGDGPVGEAMKPLMEMLNVRVPDASPLPEAMRPDLECPQCGAKYFGADGRRPDESYECCNEECKGMWGTGCWHCHHPKFFENRIDPEDEDNYFDDELEDSEEVSAFSGEIKIWNFPIRRDCIVRVDLPIDVTAKEAERFAWFVKSLVIK